MITFQQLLSEGRDAPLYHGTWRHKAIQIVKSNIFRARKATSDAPLGVSLSRSYQYSKRYADDMSGDPGSVVIFELDQRKLAQAFRIEPYNAWFDPYKYEEGIKLYSKSARNLRGKMNEGENEYEEMVFGDIAPAMRYINKIYCYYEQSSGFLRLIPDSIKHTVEPLVVERGYK